MHFDIDDVETWDHYEREDALDRHRFEVSIRLLRGEV